MIFLRKKLDSDLRRIVFWSMRTERTRWIRREKISLSPNMYTFKSYLFSLLLFLFIISCSTCQNLCGWLFLFWILWLTIACWIICSPFNVAGFFVSFFFNFFSIGLKWEYAYDMWLCASLLFCHVSQISRVFFIILIKYILNFKSIIKISKSRQQSFNKEQIIDTKIILFLIK